MSRQKFAYFSIQITVQNFRHKHILHDVSVALTSYSFTVAMFILLMTVN